MRGIILLMAAEPVLVPPALRLEADLRTRFPVISVRFLQHEEGDWTCEVQEGGLLWGSMVTRCCNAAM
jgi:hypothetical protein